MIIKGDFTWLLTDTKMKQQGGPRSITKLSLQRAFDQQQLVEVHYSDSPNGLPNRFEIENKRGQFLIGPFQFTTEQGRQIKEWAVGKETRKEKRNKALRQLQQFILSLPEPEQFNMRDWAVAKPALSCGYAACLAGSACVMDGRHKLLPNHAFPQQLTTIVGPSRHKLSRSIEDFARIKLHLTEREAEILFFIKGVHMTSRGWPEPFAGQYQQATSGRERVKITVERIDHFIETGK